MGLKVEIEKAIEEVQKVFPFKNYIDKSTYYEIHAILCEIIKFLPEYKQKRLLDIGCGPMDKTAIFCKLGFQCFAVDDLSDPWHKRNENIFKIKEFAKKLELTFITRNRENITCHLK